MGLKKLLLFFVLTVFLFGAQTTSYAQLLYPAKWTFSVENKTASEATLVFKVKLDEGWHMYSQFTPAGGPLPMIFTFEPNKCYETLGKVSESKPEVEFDSTFEVNVFIFHHQATFKQKVKLKSNANCEIKGIIEYQVCKEACIFKDTSFIFSIKSLSGSSIEEGTSAGKPIDSSLASNLPANHIDTSTQNQASVTESFTEGLEPGCGETEGAVQDYASLWGIFIGGILGGLLALLTPCVFPMIPMTVSFFTKRSKDRKKGISNAFLYALFIMIIYVGLGLLVTVTLGSDALNDLASNAFFNLSFFVIFIIFALSFFGAFEIVLPSALVNKADAASDRGGVIGIFFMAFTLSLVSFSCTGPIIGTLLVEAAHGRSYMGPLVGMTGFALALALPFAFFAAFPGYLNSLPKSGGWLNVVKVSLGFIELALALKFLSNVDLAYHWGILKREVFITLWIIIFGLMGMYLLGRIKFAHDSEVQHVSVTRLIFSIITLSFTLYLIPGLWGAPLKLISGFPPPDFYKEWKTEAHDCPHDLNCFHDYDEGMAYAKSQDKPVMVDFTGWSCVNCRKMEDNVWSDAKVLKRIAEDYVLISLYVDDKEPLPSEKQYTSTVTGKKIKTTGNKWSEFQASKYQTNSQPYYVLLDNNAQILAKPRGYTPDIPTYTKFLDEGLCRYEIRSQK
ncbi:MAG TPA: cytochrome c biogenesis protein CcdA [Bacteroidia bacterium]|nr:cytochrome c biogenesis protein CcdA [Bacteroidia bacterium]